MARLCRATGDVSGERVEEQIVRKLWITVLLLCLLPVFALAQDAVPAEVQVLDLCRGEGDYRCTREEVDAMLAANQ